MPVANPIDLLDFMRKQRGERQPTFVVLGPPLSGKTAFARQLTARSGCGYLNVLDAFSQSPDQARLIDRFDEQALRRWLIDQAAPPIDMLLVDDLDFLIPTWDDLTPFKEMVRTLIHPDRTVVFGFFLQTRSDFDDWTLLRGDRKTSRILRLDEIQAID